MLRRPVVAGSILLLALTFAPLAGFAQPQGNVTPEARALAQDVMKALGGQQAWDNTRFIKFTFVGRRTHWWDKWTGRHRIEGQTQDGKRYVVLENINTKEGTAWVDGQKAEGEKAAELVKNAYAAWINDTYWLLMPYKLLDPGVNLSLDGQETIDGKTYDKLALSFGQVGLTPGDRYWAYINRDTKLMDRWAFILESMPKEGPPSVWRWDGWTKHGNIMLAPNRQQVTGGDRKLDLSNIAVYDQLPDTVFTSPEAVQ